MAQMIPEDLPAKASGGEQRLFQILRRLPDDVVAYYEPRVENRLPDFVVILPTLGILLIEVKGWYLPNIIAADPHSVRVRHDEREIVHAHPSRQVREYHFGLMDRCAKDKKFSELVNLSGNHEGRLSFPVASFAVLSNITRPSLDGFPKSQEVFPSSAVATKDQLAEWERIGPDGLLEIFKGYFRSVGFTSPMSPNQVNIVKAILHPEVLLSLDFPKGQSEEPTVRVLDARQETVARQIGSGHRLIFGVAGCGKTVVLVARAKLLARLTPARVLVLCYNVALAAYLSEELTHFSTVTVMNFHAWAASNGAQWDKNNDSELGQNLLAILRNEGPDSHRYDSILIDEAQDMEADWFSCVLAAMKDPANGDLLIVGDSSQGVYRRSSISWKQIGIRAQGRTQYLELNYRNTRPILRLASLFASADGAMEEDALGTIRVDPENCVRKHGPDPVLLKRANKREEVDRIIRVIEDLLDGRWFGHEVTPVKPEGIGIVYPRLRKEDRKTVQDLCARLQTNRQGCPVVWLSETSASRRRIGEAGVKILTMHAAKGLQFQAVIILFADECPAHFPDTDEAAERRLFYVALTRAEDFLAVSCSRSSKFIADIEAALASGGCSKPQTST